MEKVPERRVSRLEPVTEGAWAGWEHDPDDPFEDLAGPFYTRRDADGRIRCAFRCEGRHLNVGGFLHGGCLMTFADYALFCIARDALAGAPGVTTTFTGDFLSAVDEGALVECVGEVIKAGRSLVFFRGMITAGGEPVMAFSSVIKKTPGQGRGVAFAAS